MVQATSGIITVDERRPVWVLLSRHPVLVIEPVVDLIRVAVPLGLDIAVPVPVIGLRKAGREGNLRRVRPQIVEEFRAIASRVPDIGQVVFRVIGVPGNACGR